MLSLILLTALVCALVSRRGAGWTAGAPGPALAVAGLPALGGPGGLGMVASVALAVLAAAWPVVWRARRPGGPAPDPSAAP